MLYKISSFRRGVNDTYGRLGC